MRQKLTHYSIKSLPFGSQYVVWDETLPAFGVRVAKTTKTFILKKGRWYVIGRYPSVSLKDAREEARRRLALKYFPQERTANAQHALRQYLDLKGKSLRPGTYRNVSRTLTTHFTFQGNLSDLTREQLLKAAQRGGVYSSLGGIIKQSPRQPVGWVWIFME